MNEVYGEKTEYHRCSDEKRARSFATYVAKEEDCTFVALIAVRQDGDMKYLSQDVIKGNKA